MSERSGGPAVLVVDDDTRLTRFVLRTLDAYGAHGVATSALAEAREQSASCEFDAFVIDENLPDGRGTSLLSEIRAGAGRAPIVVWSGDRHEVHMQRAAAFDAVYVDKPIGIDVVADLLTWIGQGKRGDPDAARTRLRLSRGRPSATPRGIRRALVRGATNDRLARVPQGPDTIVVVGAMENLVVPEDAKILRTRGTGAVSLAAICAAASVAAIIVDASTHAIDLDGVLGPLRAERPDTPVLALLAREPRSTDARQMALSGIAYVSGGRAELCAAAFAFADDMLMQHDLRRRALEVRALGWELTPRETELAWLASMIVSRERVRALFGRAFDKHLENVRTKVGAESFEALGRIARG